MMKLVSNKFLVIAIIAAAALLAIPMISAYAHIGTSDTAPDNYGNYGRFGTCPGPGGYGYAEDYYESNLDKEELDQKFAEEVEYRLSRYRERLEYLVEIGEITAERKEELLAAESEYLEARFNKYLEENEEWGYSGSRGRHHRGHFGGSRHGPGYGPLR